MSLQTVLWRPFIRWWTSDHAAISQLLSLVMIQGVIAVFGFLTRVGVANSLGPADFGNLAFAVALGTYGQTFIFFGLEKSLVRDLVHFPHRAGELLKASLLLRFTLFATVLILTVPIVGWVSRTNTNSWKMFPAFVATLLGAFQLNGVYDAWREMRRHALYSMVERFLYFGLVWLCIVSSWWTLSLSRVGLVMLATVVAGLWLQYYWALPRMNFQAVEGTWSTQALLLRSNLWIWLAALASLSIEYLNQIILRWYAGTAELGKYSAAWLFISLGLLVLGQVARMGSEGSARHTRGETMQHEQQRFLLRYVLLMAVMGAVVGLPCILFSRQLLLLFRSEYASSASTLRILGFMPIVYGPYLAVLQFVISRRLHKTYLLLISIAGLFTVGLSIAFVPRLGSIGAAISAVISMAIALGLFLGAAWFDLQRSRVH